MINHDDNQNNGNDDQASLCANDLPLLPHRPLLLHTCPILLLSQHHHRSSSSSSSSSPSSSSSSSPTSPTSPSQCVALEPILIVGPVLLQLLVLHDHLLVHLPIPRLDQLLLHRHWTRRLRSGRRMMIMMIL